MHNTTATANPSTIPAVHVEPDWVPFDTEEDGKIVPPLTSEIVIRRTMYPDPDSPIFGSSEEKDAFLATMPTAIQLLVNQQFRKDSEHQTVFLCAKNQLFLLYESGFMSNSVQKELKRAFPLIVVCQGLDCLFSGALAACSASCKS
jgi:hypothetical protein